MFTPWPAIGWIRWAESLDHSRNSSPSLSIINPTQRVPAVDEHTDWHWVAECRMLPQRSNFSVTNDLPKAEKQRVISARFWWSSVDIERWLERLFEKNSIDPQSLIFSSTWDHLLPIGSHTFRERNDALLFVRIRCLQGKSRFQSTILPDLRMLCSLHWRSLLRTVASMTCASTWERSTPMNYAYCLTKPLRGSSLNRRSHGKRLTGRQAMGPVGKNRCQATTLSGI